MQAMFAEQTEDDRVTVAEGTFDGVGAGDNLADLIVIAQLSASRSLLGAKSRILVAGIPLVSRLRKSYPGNL